MGTIIPKSVKCHSATKRQQSDGTERHRPSRFATSKIAITHYTPDKLKLKASASETMLRRTDCGRCDPHSKTAYNYWVPGSPAHHIELHQSRRQTCCRGFRNLRKHLRVVGNAVIDARMHCFILSPLLSDPSPKPGGPQHRSAKLGTAKAKHS